MTAAQEQETEPAPKQDRPAQRLPRTLRNLTQRLQRGTPLSLQLSRQAADLLLAQHAEILQLQSRERASRVYPWPPNSPAGRLSRLQPAAQADIAAVLQTYALLIQICQTGEENP